MNTKSLESLRKEIDELDEKLVVLLTQRMNVALAIADLKDNSISSVQAKHRVKKVLDRVAKIASNNNGNEQFVRKIYSVIIEELTTLQLMKKGLM
ncbi:chorismate mutase [Mixta theicola]|uniref:chorismate mutase n=1 Tax=Mixta theicola TaxID=1458355 RepID=UPI0013FDB985|nr:chorismate mutase [Mixta theicola]GLR10930.1 hypothetical protein GCM10007905_36500 [Mixta theicola]